MRVRTISRRALLRGLGGAALALPALEIMSPSRGGLSAAPLESPRRYVVAYAGISLGSIWGGASVPIDQTYIPVREGFDYDLPPALASLAEFDDVRNEISVITELKIPWAAEYDGTVPPGGRHDRFHTTTHSPQLCGTRTQYESDALCWGPSSDQIVADHIAGESRFRVLAYMIQASKYRAGDLVGHQLSQRDNGGLDQLALPIEPVRSPKAAFDALFFNFGELEDPAVQARRDYEWRARLSVLDFVRGETQRLTGRLGRVDRIRLEQHLDEVRELERQIATVPDTLGGACRPLDDPGADPLEGEDLPLDEAGEYGYSPTAAWSDEERRALVFVDLVHMAFACDLARCAALTITMASSNLNMFPATGRDTDVHGLGHTYHASEGLAEGLSWHYRHFGRLVSLLRDTPEADGSMLDQSALVLCHEGGYGYDPEGGEDGNPHSSERMACLIAGRAGGMRNGQHVRKVGAHPAQVLITAMNALGVDGGLGEVEGNVSELVG